MLSVPQSASPPHAPSQWWTCRSLPVTNGARCRQGWGGQTSHRCRELLGQAGTRGGGQRHRCLPRLERRAVPQGEGGEGGVRGVGEGEGEEEKNPRGNQKGKGRIRKRRRRVLGCSVQKGQRFQSGRLSMSYIGLYRSLGRCLGQEPPFGISSRDPVGAGSSGNGGRTAGQRNGERRNRGRWRREKL